MQSISHTNVQPNNKKQSKMAPRVRPTVPFLEKLGTATTKKECGMYLFEGFLSPREAKDAFDVLVDDAKFPWDTKPELNGEPLSQQACEHDLLESAKEQKKKNGRIKYNSNMKGLLKLGELFARIERDFDIKVNCVCCNRFPSLENQLEWQKKFLRRTILCIDPRIKTPDRNPKQQNPIHRNNDTECRRLVCDAHETQRYAHTPSMLCERYGPNRVGCRCSLVLGLLLRCS